MSFKAINLALESDYQPTTKLLLLVLAESADNTDFTCYPSWKTLMKRTSIKSRNTIAKHLKILEDNGTIKRTRRFETSNFYQLFPKELGSTKNVPSPPNDTTLVSNGGTTLVSNGETLTVNEQSSNNKGDSLKNKTYNSGFSNLWSFYSVGNKYKASQCYSKFLKVYKDDIDNSKRILVEILKKEKEKDDYRKHLTTILNNLIQDISGVYEEYKNIKKNNKPKEWK